MVSGTSGVNNHLLCFVDMEDQVVGATPLHQMLHLPSVGLFVVILDEAHHCCVVRVLEDVVSTGSSLTVVCHQGEQMLWKCLDRLFYVVLMRHYF